MSSTFSEFGLIESIKAKFSALTPSGVEGIGDDCAIIPIGGDRAMVITSDMLGEGVHFLRDIDPYRLGVRAVQVNISDVASMGARPTALLLSIALPEWVDSHWLERFFEGIHSCGVALIGGDTTRSKGGLTLSVTALGEAPTGSIKRRSGAKVGDTILVSGRLGASAASLYQSEVRAQIEEGVWLGGREEVSAMMDISDGLAGDLLHILSSSGVGATVELSSIPIADGATLQDALSGGEDFMLLLCASEPEELRRAYQERFGCELFEVGQITEGSELTFTESGATVEYSGGGFKHF